MAPSNLPAEAPAAAPAEAPADAPAEAPKKEKLTFEMTGPAGGLNPDVKFGEDAEQQMVVVDGYCFLICASTKKRWEAMIEKKRAELYKYWKDQLTQCCCPCCCMCCQQCCGAGKPLSDEEVKKRVERDLAKYIELLKQEVKLVELIFSLPKGAAANDFNDLLKLDDYRKLMVFQFTSKGLHTVGLPNYQFEKEMKVPIPFYTTTLSGGCLVTFNSGIETHIKVGATTADTVFTYKDPNDGIHHEMFVDFKTTRYMVQSMLQDLPMVVSDAQSHVLLKTVLAKQNEEAKALEFPWNNPEVFVYTDMVDEFTTLKRVSEFFNLDFSANTSDQKSAFDERLAKEIEGGAMDKSFYSYLLYLNGALQFPGAWALMPYVKQAHVALYRTMNPTHADKKQDKAKETTGFQDQRKAFMDLYRPCLEKSVDGGKTLLADGKDSVYKVFVTETCMRPPQDDLQNEVQTFYEKLKSGLESPPSMQILMGSCFDYDHESGKCVPVIQKKGMALVSERLKAINTLDRDGTGWKLKAKAVGPFILISDKDGKFGDFAKEKELIAAVLAAGQDALTNLAQDQPYSMNMVKQPDANKPESGKFSLVNAPEQEKELDDEILSPKGEWLDRGKYTLTARGPNMSDIKAGAPPLIQIKGKEGTLHLADEGVALLLLGGETYGQIKMGRPDSKITLTESIPSAQEPQELVGFIDKDGVPQCKEIEKEQEEWFENEWNPRAQANAAAASELQSNATASKKLEAHAKGKDKAIAAKAAEGKPPPKFKDWDTVSYEIFKGLNEHDAERVTKDAGLAAIMEAEDDGKGGVDAKYGDEEKVVHSSPDGETQKSVFWMFQEEVVKATRDRTMDLTKIKGPPNTAKKVAGEIVKTALNQMCNKKGCNEYLNLEAVKALTHKIEIIVHDVAACHLTDIKEITEEKHMTKVASGADTKSEEGATITVVPPDELSQASWAKYMIVAGRKDASLKGSGKDHPLEPTGSLIDLSTTDYNPGGVVPHDQESPMQCFKCSLMDHLGTNVPEWVLNKWGLTNTKTEMVGDEIMEPPTVYDKHAEPKHDGLVSVDEIVLYAIPVDTDKDSAKVTVVGSNSDKQKDIWLASYNWGGPHGATMGPVNSEPPRDNTKPSKLLKAIYGITSNAQSVMDLSPLLFTDKKTLMWVDVMQHCNVGPVCPIVVRSMVYIYKSFKTLPLYIMPMKMGGDDPDKAAGRGWITQEASNGIFAEKILAKIADEKGYALPGKTAALELAFKLQRMKHIIGETSVASGKNLAGGSVNDPDADEGNEGSSPSAKSTAPTPAPKKAVSYDHHTSDDEKAALDDVVNAPTVALQVCRALARARFGITTEMDRYVATTKWAATLGCFQKIIDPDMFEQPIGKVSVKKYGFEGFEYDPDFVYGVDTYACCGCCCLGTPNPEDATAVTLAKMIYHQEEKDVADMKKGALWDKGVRRLLLIALANKPNMVTSSLANYRLINALGLGRLDLFTAEDLIHGARRIKVHGEDVKEANKVLKAGKHPTYGSDVTLTVRIVGSTLVIMSGKTEKGGMLTTVKSHEVDEEGEHLIDPAYVG